MTAFPKDIFTEPHPEPDTLANLGPLRPLAGTWRGTLGQDAHPAVEGSGRDRYVEHYVLTPIDAQTNGPQLFYGLHYRTHITKPGEVEAFHDQTGYWLWEPASGQVLLTVAIPRAQVALAIGAATPDATSFTVSARAGDPHCGIVTNPFLDHAFHTREFSMTVTVVSDDEWSYRQDTVLEVRGAAEGPFHHTDHNTLARVAPAVLNPMAGGPQPV